MFHIFAQAIPPIPTDFTQLGAWLLMPAVIALFANLVITEFASNDTPDQKNFVRFIVFIVDGLASYGLTLFAPAFVTAIQPLWAILATAIAAYYAPQAIGQIWFGMQLLGMRFLMGRDAFAKAYTITVTTKAAVKANNTIAKKSTKSLDVGAEPHG